MIFNVAKNKVVEKVKNELPKNLRVVEKVKRGYGESKVGLGIFRALYKKGFKNGN